MLFISSQKYKEITFMCISKIQLCYFNIKCMIILQKKSQLRLTGERNENIVRQMESY